MTAHKEGKEMTRDVSAAIHLLLGCGYGVFKVPTEVLPRVQPSAPDDSYELAMGQQNYSVNEFCMLYGIGRTFFYELLKAGRGPQIIKVGRKTLIPRHCAEAWQESMEAVRD